MELTREEAIKLHRELWGWLAENPMKRKYNWPGWEQRKKIQYDCFCCHLVNRRGGIENCKNCPLEWPLTKSEVDVLFTPCVNSYFDDWNNTKKPEELSRLAALIRDLPEKAEKKEMPAPRFAVGDKVVPVSKSIGEFAGEIDSEPNWKDSKKRGYFYVTQSFLHDGKQAYGCHSEDIRAGGNYFLESDLRPYVEPEPNPAPKPFRVGDRVRCIEETSGLITTLGKTGTIIDVWNSGCFAVEFDENLGGLKHKEGKEGHCWTYNSPSFKNSFVLLPPSNLCPENKTVTLETVTVTFKDNKTTCIIENELGRFKGCAKCSPDDVWDEEIGKKLAIERATEKMEAAKRTIIPEMKRVKATEEHMRLIMEVGGIMELRRSQGEEAYLARFYTWCKKVRFVLGTDRLMTFLPESMEFVLFDAPADGTKYKQGVNPDRTRYLDLTKKA